MKPCSIALPALVVFSAAQGCAPVYETRTSRVISRTPLASGSTVVERRPVLTRAQPDAEGVAVTVMEHRRCRRPIVERRVVEDRIEREVDTSIFTLEVIAATGPPLLAIAAKATEDNVDHADGTTHHDDFGLEPVFGGAILVLTGIAVTAVIVDANAARDEVQRRTETHALGFATLDCAAAPASGVRVELLLPDGSRFDGETDATGVAHIALATERPSHVDVLVAGKLAGRVRMGEDATSPGPER